MLRHRRSLAALPSFASTPSATPRRRTTAPRSRSASQKDGGLIRRVSSLFRSSSSSKNTGSFTPTARYTSAASTPDVRLVTGGRLVKRTSTKLSLQSPPLSLSLSTSTSTPNRSRSLASSLGRSPKSKLSALPALPRSFPQPVSSSPPGKSAKSKSRAKFSRGKPLPAPSSASEDEDEEDDISRPAAGGAASLLGSEEDEGRAYARGSGSSYDDDRDREEDDEEGEDDIRRPAGLGPPAPPSARAFAEEWQFGVCRPRGGFLGGVRGKGRPAHARTLGADGCAFAVPSAGFGVFVRLGVSHHGEGWRGHASSLVPVACHTAQNYALLGAHVHAQIHTRVSAQRRFAPRLPAALTAQVPPKSAQREADLLAGRSHTSSTPPRRTAPHLSAPLWALILSFSSSSSAFTSAGHLTSDHMRVGDVTPRMSEGLTKADAASVARVCRTACEGARGRLYGMGEERGREETEERTNSALVYNGHTSRGAWRGWFVRGGRRGVGREGGVRAGGEFSLRLRPSFRIPRLRVLRRHIFPFRASPFHSSFIHTGAPLPASSFLCFLRSSFPIAFHVRLSITFPHPPQFRAPNSFSMSSILAFHPRPSFTSFSSSILLLHTSVLVLVSRCCYSHPPSFLHVSMTALPPSYPPPSESSLLRFCASIARCPSSILRPTFTSCPSPVLVLVSPCYSHPPPFFLFLLVLHDHPFSFVSPIASSVLIRSRIHRSSSSSSYHFFPHLFSYVLPPCFAAPFFSSYPHPSEFLPCVHGALSVLIRSPINSSSHPSSSHLHTIFLIRYLYYIHSPCCFVAPFFLSPQFAQPPFLLRIPHPSSLLHPVSLKEEIPSKEDTKVYSL
ncbi:hypothetical protein C8R44DRAFT_979212 [Mycena epipterygia]|nr:hypothetical protein C8R44DRAFT_979212 [Mycena epipterygia]